MNIWPIHGNQHVNSSHARQLGIMKLRSINLKFQIFHDVGHFKNFDSVKDPMGHYYLNERD